MTQRGNYHFDLHRLCDRQQRDLEVAPGDGHVVYLPIPEQVSLDFGLLMRDLRNDERPA
jgi:putative protease